ncbi:hypothetical protein J2127_000992 [Methanococcus voltae]|nr:hypothetical protein [Methanococcus voltae]
MKCKFLFELDTEKEKATNAFSLKDMFAFIVNLFSF